MNTPGAGARLIIVCGLPGSGKTTRARRLEAHLGAVRLAPDEWMAALALDLWDAVARARIEALQWELARTLLSRGLTVVIEWGTWARAERDTLRLGARALGAAVELHHLTAPPEVLLERVRRRNREKPRIELADILQWNEAFQAPTDDEVMLFDASIVTDLEPDKSERDTSIEVRTEDYRSLAEYAAIPIAFEVCEVVDLARLSLDGSPLVARPVAPWVKNYDALPDNHPLDWSRRFNTADWIFLAAYLAHQRLGGAIVVTNRSEAALLGARSDGSLLWDLRVAPTHRRRGIGHALLVAAEAAARVTGSQHLDVETQDSNVPACQLYAAAGFRLAAVTPGAYGSALNETRLIWTKRLH